MENVAIFHKFASMNICAGALKHENNYEICIDAIIRNFITNEAINKRRRDCFLNQ